MGRPRSYDREAALEAAGAAFQEKGYNATSLADLEAATGMQRASLYLAFGDKANIFKAALEHYTKPAAQPIAEFLSCEDLYEGLCRLFRVFVDSINAEPAGCLACVSAALAGTGSVPDFAIREVWSQFEDTLRSGLDRHADKLAVPAETAARLLITLLQGLACQARAGRGGAPLHQTALLAINALFTEDVRASAQISLS